MDLRLKVTEEFTYEFNLPKGAYITDCDNEDDRLQLDHPLFTLNVWPDSWNYSEFLPPQKGHRLTWYTEGDSYDGLRSILRRIDSM